MNGMTVLYLVTVNGVSVLEDFTREDQHNLSWFHFELLRCLFLQLENEVKKLIIS